MDKEVNARRRKWTTSLLLGCALIACQGCSEPEKTVVGAGAQAHTFLTHDTYANLVIEVDLMGNVSAEPIVRDIAMSQVRKTLNKPGKISALIQRPDREFVESSSGYTLDAIEAIEEQHRDTKNEEDTASLYVMYLPGHWHEDSPEAVTLGLAVGETAMAIFPDTIRGTCSSGKGEIDDPEAKALLCPLTEAAVWLHEFGHLIGLVDNGVPMQSAHLDEAHGSHDTNATCIMYWENESAKLAKFIEQRLKNGNTELNVFGQACRDDMDAFRAGN